MLESVEKMFACVHANDTTTTTASPTRTSSNKRSNNQFGRPLRQISGDHQHKPPHDDDHKTSRHTSSSAHVPAGVAALSQQLQPQQLSGGRVGVVEPHDNDGNIDQEDDQEVFDSVVAEGMKYKRKCKALKAALFHVETRCLADKTSMSCQIEEMRLHCERLLKEQQAQHFIELTQCNDSRTRECESLR
jgi:hypothetical protein